MPTSRTLLAVLLASAMASVGCAASSSDDASSSSADLSGEVARAGIAAGTFEEEGVLILANDRAVGPDVLVSAGVRSDVATEIANFKAKGPDGKAQWFKSLDDIAALPNADSTVFTSLLNYARTNNYVEQVGFDAPDQVKIKLPDGIVGPPTSANISIEAGFDGLTPNQVILLVRGRVTNEIYAQNEDFVKTTIGTTFKSFTIGLNNLIASNSPYATFLNSLNADRVTLLGTMSAINPYALLAEKDGQSTYYFNNGQGFQAVDWSYYHYPIIMRSRVRLPNDPDGPGVRLFYPAWSAKVLAGPTGTVTESP